MSLFKKKSFPSYNAGRHDTFGMFDTIFKYVFPACFVLFPVMFIGIIVWNVWIAFYAPCDVARGLPVLAVPTRCLDLPAQERIRQEYPQR